LVGVEACPRQKGRVGIWGKTYLQRAFCTMNVITNNERVNRFILLPLNRMLARLPFMNDDQFLKNINRITAENGLRLPMIGEAPSPSAEVSAWAEFLELCVKNGIKISDQRWRRLAFARQKPVTVFELQGPSSEPSDTEFRVGLQLLIGMLEKDGES